MTRGFLVVLLVTAAACGSDTSTTTTSTPASSAATTTSTSSTTTSTSVPSSTPDTPVDAPLVLWGSSLRYSPDGTFLLQGTWSEGVTVSLEGYEVNTSSAVDGTHGGWQTEVVLGEGVHELALTATDTVGATTRLPLTLVVDASLEVEFAWVADVTTKGDSVSITADYAQFLSGEEANRAAREAGEIGEGETVPNDYYILNENPRLRELTIGPDAPIVLQVCFVSGPCVVESPVTIPQWVSLVTTGGSDDLPVAWQWYGAGHLPYWLTLKDGVVVQITEQYLP